MLTNRLMVALLAVCLCAASASAQVHQATPVEVLLEQLGITHDHTHQHGSDMTMAISVPMPVTDAMPPAVVLSASSRAVDKAAATKTFTITAHQFAFDISPSPFVVNQGDEITLNIKSTDVVHGFFMDQYVAGAGQTLIPGRTVTVHFIADTPGTFTYLCTQPSCGTGHFNMNGVFTVNAAVQIPPPSITSIDPTGGPSAGGTSVTITGADFQTGASVTFGSTPGTNVNVQNATTISAVAPFHAPGTVGITVTNPDSQSATFNSYAYVAAPTISAVAPQSGDAGGGTQITINGSGFTAGATVTVGGVPATSVNVVNSTTITATVPPAPASSALPLSVDVVVRNADGQLATDARAFTWTQPAPVLGITMVLPDGAVPAGGTTVTILGSGFSAGATPTLTFGGVAATNVTVLGPTAISATVPPHAAGAVDVVITAGSSNATAHAAFTYGTNPPRRRSVRH